MEARRFVGPRRNSVFFTPVRVAVEAPGHAEATAVALRRSGHGISRQANALGAKILEGERWRWHVGVPVWEVRPERLPTTCLTRRSRRGGPGGSSAGRACLFRTPRGPTP